MIEIEKPKIETQELSSDGKYGKFMSIYALKLRVSEA